MLMVLLISWYPVQYCRNAENLVSFVSEGLLYWLKAKDILCGLAAKCFHVHIVLQSEYAYALFKFLLRVIVIQMLHIVNSKTIRTLRAGLCCCCACGSVHLHPGVSCGVLTAPQWPSVVGCEDETDCLTALYLLEHKSGFTPLARSI